MISKAEIRLRLERVKMFKELSYSVIDLPCNLSDIFPFACENRAIDRRFYLNYTEILTNEERIQKFGGLNISRFNYSYPDIYFEKYFTDKDYDSKMNLAYYTGPETEKLSSYFAFLESLLNDSFVKEVLMGKAWGAEYHKHLYESINR